MGRNFFSEISKKFPKFFQILKKNTIFSQQKGQSGEILPPIFRFCGGIISPTRSHFYPFTISVRFFSPSLKKYAAAAKYTQRERECTKEECSGGRFLLSNFIVKDSLSAAEDLGEFLTFPEMRQRIYDEI